MCFLTTTFRNPPAHPPPPVLIDQSLTEFNSYKPNQPKVTVHGETVCTKYVAEANCDLREQPHLHLLLNFSCDISVMVILVKKCPKGRAGPHIRLLDEIGGHYSISPMSV